MSFSVKRNDLPYLDGLRAIAALVVLSSHFGNLGWANFGNVTLAGAGKSGVYLFFLLSAYLLTRIAFMQADRFWSMPELARFFMRRVLRIFPLFIVYLLICFATTQLTPLFMEAPRGFAYTMSGEDLWRHLTLREGKGVLWSIPVEFKYYLLLPVVALALWQGLRRAPKTTIAIAIVLCLLVEAYLVARGNRSGGTYLRSYLQIFLLGSLFAGLDMQFFSKQTQQSATMRTAMTALFFVSTAALIIMTPAAQTALLGPQAMDLTQHYMLHGLAWLGILAGLRLGHTALQLPFKTKALRYVGLISFSLYLWHEFVIAILTTLGYGGLGWATWVLPLLLSLGLSHLSFHAIEKPFLSFNPTLNLSPRRSLGS